MRLISYTTVEGPAWGIASNDGIIDATRHAGGKFPDLKSWLDRGTAGDLDAIADASAGDRVDPGEIRYLPVVPEPGKIFCIGINYVSHREETGREATAKPTVFTRFADTLTGHREPILRPKVSTSLDYEGELAVIIGRRGRYIEPRDAMSYVAGFSCFNDATLRDFQRHTSQFTPGKNFPSTAALGPELVTVDEAGDGASLPIRTRLNGALMQDADTSMLIFDIPALIAYLSSFTGLSPGDVIATGTPGGVGFKRNPPVFMQPGDEVVVEIDGIGTLVSPVTAEGE